MPYYVRTLGPSHLVSIIQPELQPDTPPEISPVNHLRVQVHDISKPEFGAIVPARQHVRELIEFLENWQMDAPLLAHCYAGISRSTATALIARAIKTGDPMDAAMALRKAAPHARPNSLIIDLADDILGLDGHLVEAKQAMGEGIITAENSLIELPAA